MYLLRLFTGSADNDKSNNQGGPDFAARDNVAHQSNIGKIERKYAPLHQLTTKWGQNILRFQLACWKAAKLLQRLK